MTAVVGGERPLLREWTAEKAAAIDWTDAEEVLQHCKSFLHVASFHPKLEEWYNEQPSDYRRQLMQLFLETAPSSVEQQKTFLAFWLEEGLLTLRDERWCRKCGSQGHTMKTCTIDESALKPNAALQYRQHMDELERRRLVGSTKAHGTKETMRAPPKKVSVSDEFYRGTIRTADSVWKKGEVFVAGLGLLPFHFARCEYGLKRIRAGDDVRLHLEHYEDRRMAVDIVPLNRELLLEDIEFYTKQCEECNDPIKQMTSTLSQKSDWKQLLVAVQKHEHMTEKTVNSIIRMTTFLPNRSPVHLHLLRAFLKLLLFSTSTSDGETISFFPALVRKVCPKPETALLHLETQPNFVDGILELCDFLQLLRCHTAASHDSLLQVTAPLRPVVDLLLGAMGVTAVNKKKLTAASEYLKISEETNPLLSAIPTASELNDPPNAETSALYHGNLPCTNDQFESPAEYIAAHARLLRADTFEAAARILAAGCFELPGVFHDENTQADVEHSRIYHNVKYLGRAVWKGWDSAGAHVFQIEPKDRQVIWDIALPRLQFVCLTTGLDRSKIEEGEIFWGMIGDPDPALKHQGIVPITPCYGDFDRLAANLARNASLNQTGKSMLLETTVFFNGYEPVMNAMLEFLRPRGPAFPLPNSTVHGNVPPVTDSTTVQYVPPFCAKLYEGIVNDIRNRLVLDPGQDTCMKSVPKRDVVLVQGPPGTGKSFIGCRVVDSFVKLSQSIGSGEILSSLETTSLPLSAMDSLTPSLGPVVVITYKNHALDEFLIDLARSGLWCQGRRAAPGSPCACSGSYSTCCAKCCKHHAKLVRIGGGSQETTLMPYNLNSLVKAESNPREVIQARARVATLTRRIERICAEVHQLERGVVSEAFMKLWLTDEQKMTFSFKDDYERWLAGENYIGKADERYVQPLNTLLKTPLCTALETPAPAVAGAFHSSVTLPPKGASGDDSDDDGDLTVFASMRREVERERVDDNCRPTMISQEALGLITNPPKLPEDIPSTLQSLWSLSPYNRHEYMLYLIKRQCAQRAQEYLQACSALEVALVLLNHARDQLRLRILQGADVIGLTTTGCAMNQNLLREIKPRILVVEEAAEILESQLIACMTPSLEQIVLIGDHYQLQPKVETMLYAKHNWMNISMFERLAGKLPVAQLVEQRRMRPGLSRLVRPFYKKQPVEDHASVHTRPFIDEDGNCFTGSEPIPGLVHECFFWSHKQEEEVASVGRSKVNTLEITMVEQLARHLVRERVRPTSITVITPYLGQKRAIQQALRRHRDTIDVRVSTVDRFQGDENDVIILSLVRTQNLTSFLRLRNRMIVSCSRARFALTIIGSDELLIQSDHWRQLLKLLQETKAVGEELPIRVGDTEHRIKSTEASSAWPTRRRKQKN